MNDSGTGRIISIVVIGVLALLVVRAVIGVFWGIVSLVVFILYAFAILDVLTSSRSPLSRLAWVVVILAVPVVGAAVYLLGARQPALGS